MFPDYYNLSVLLDENQKLIEESTSAWVNQFVRPVIDSAFNDSKSLSLVKELAELGAFGLIIPEKYGGLGFDFVSFGLMMKELEKGDSSVRVVSSIQTSLVMYSIYKYGNEEQKRKYLPKLASGEILGSFAMSEPSHGSDISNMRTKFEIRDEKIVILGSKLWIGNASNADISIVWAKNSNDKVQAIVVETKNITNFKSTLIEGKMSFRSSHTGELFFDSSIVSKDQLLQKTKSIKDAYECLNIGRYAVAWGSLGIAEECYNIALKYSKEREQFGKPIAGKQLIQKKLVDMITEITKSQLICYRLGKIMDSGKIDYKQFFLNP